MQVLIDKVNLIITIDDPKMYQTIIAYMYSLKIEMKGKVKLWDCLYGKKCYVKYDHNIYMHVYAGITHGKLYVRFDFNVSKSQKSLFDLKKEISYWLWNDFEKLSKYLRVNYFEIAVDLPGQTFKSIESIYTKSKKFLVGMQYETSVYLGHQDSPIHFCIYDKQKQLKDTLGVHLPDPLTRVECRLKMPNVVLSDLDKLENPFVGLILFNKNFESNIHSKSIVWNKYRKELADGKKSQEIYTSLKPEEKKALGLRAALARYDWWVIDDIWEAAKMEIIKFLDPSPISSDCNQLHLEYTT